MSPADRERTALNHLKTIARAVRATMLRVRRQHPHEASVTVTVEVDDVRRALAALDRLDYARAAARVTCAGGSA